MTEAKILTSIQSIPNYLNTIGINYELKFKAKDISPSKFSNEYYFQSNNSTCYEKIYTVALEHNDYDILIVDDQSFFQFSAEKNKKNEINKIRYAFFPTYKPIQVYKEISEQFAKDQPLDEIISYSLSLSDNNPYVCPVRYDYSVLEYKEHIHPVAHLHIGFNNDIRIPVSKILKPCQFVDFIIKYFYKNAWDSGFLKNTKCKNCILSLKQQSEPLLENFFSVDERKLFYLD